MPKPRLVRSPVFPYHVYARSNNKEWFYLPMEDVWAIFCRVWSVVKERFGLKLHCFVLMRNHFHALVTTPSENLDEGMLYLMREVARQINRKSDRINHVFGGPYRNSLVCEGNYYLNVLKYIYRNPVHAQICRTVEEYPFSSLPGRLPSKPTRLPTVDCIFEENHPGRRKYYERLDWLNEGFREEARQCIRLGLKKGLFKIRTRNIAAATRRSLLIEFHERDERDHEKEAVPFL